MKTRAQKRQQAIDQANGSSLTKKEILKKKTKGNTSAGKPEGKKKLKKDDEARQIAKQPSVEKKKNVRISSNSRPKQSQIVKKKDSSTSNIQRRSSLRKKPSLDVNNDSKIVDNKVSKQKAKKADKKQPQPLKKPAKKPEVQQEKEQVKKFKFKGKVPIDEYSPQAKNDNFQILQHGGKIYSATLNQTSVQNNNNKFYILQITQNCSNSQHCYFFTRWGRVGVPGQTSNLGPFPIALAINLYNSKYHEKHNKGNYRQVQLNYEVEDQQTKKDNKKDGELKKTDNANDFQKSKLSKAVKRLIELIFDINMMNRQMVQIGYNVSKMPLGKLSKENIKLGYGILQKLMEEIKGKNKQSVVEQLTNQFYSYIPHDFGFARMSNFVLDDQKKVKKKLQMLEALAQIKVATSLLSSTDQSQNKIDSNYQKLNREIHQVDKDSSLFDTINKYLQTTHAATHTAYTLQLQDLFELKSQVEEARFTKHIGNKMLLWHGSRLTNFVGILSQGLRIAPPQAPVTGYMFGKGVYFADMSSKSANYCFTSRENSTGILLLCQVALGQMNEKLSADYYASNLPPGKFSTKGVGKTAPSPNNYVKLGDDLIVPMGPSQVANKSACHLQYNQYIVYDIAQIRIKYLLRTKFNYKQGHNLFGY